MTAYPADLPVLAESILNFWFGPLTASGGVAPAKQAQWFKKDAAFDALIKKKYGEYADLAFMGAFDHWTATPHATAALLVLLDQFPRNIYRDNERAFAYDKKGLATAWAAVTAKKHLQVPTLIGYFMAVPLMHSEHLNVQDLGVSAFQELIASASAEHQPIMKEALRYAGRHRDIIVRFGRFPHRNALLHRDSTADELAFLKEPGSSF